MFLLGAFSKLLAGKTTPEACACQFIKNLGSGMN